uniref:Uncharacterized protein n=1 Tax=Rangifer tarandus platyrhynchus TaxID=3082113 RepID=A0ACB0EHM1_RANTA|nr:unnamed protein product [Rangifer tarandus platyrhynchus]
MGSTSSWRPGALRTRSRATVEITPPPPDAGGTFNPQLAGDMKGEGNAASQPRALPASGCSAVPGAGAGQSPLSAPQLARDGRAERPRLLASGATSGAHTSWTCDTSIGRLCAAKKPSTAGRPSSNRPPASGNERQEKTSDGCFIAYGLLT